MTYKRLLLLVFSIVLFVSSIYPRDLEEIKRSGKIYIGFTTDDIRNLNYPLAKEFARYLNVELVEVIIEWDDVFKKDGVVPEGLKTDPGLVYSPDLLKNVDILCSTFSIMEWRKKLYDFAETLYSAELLIISENSELPVDYNDLAGKSISYYEGTTHEKHLLEINDEIGGGIGFVPSNETRLIKDHLAKGEVYGAVLEADEALNFLATYPGEFRIALPVSEITKTAWAVEKGSELKNEVENFFETIASNKILDEIFYKRFAIKYSTFLEDLKRAKGYDRVNRDLDQILQSKKLVVALRDRTFLYKPEGRKQFMHLLSEEFADHLGVTPEFVITPYFTKYWEMEDGSIAVDSAYTPEWFNYFDIACEVFAPLEWRKSKVELIPVYTSQYTVIARKDLEISAIEDLKGLRCVTGEKSDYEELLLENDLHNYYYDEVNNYLPDVASGKADFTILYNAFLELANYPDLEIKLTLGELDICWGVRKDQPALLKETKSFLAKSAGEGLINALERSMQGTMLQNPEAYINRYYESQQTGQLPYVSYGADDGLPQEDVFSIFQDKKAYIWFGTNSGAVRYNGREMLLFNEQRGLISNTVLDIASDTSGIVYLATTSGLARLEHDEVARVYFPEKSIKKLLVDRENRIWAVSDEGLVVLGSDFKEYRLDDLISGLPSSINNIARDRLNGDIFLASPEGLFRISKDLDKPSSKIFDGECFSVFIDNNDSIWYSTSEGIMISALAPDGKSLVQGQRSNLNKRLGFPVEIFTEITTNNFGSVWLVSDSKIFQVISTDEKPFQYEEEIGIHNNKIQSFLVDNEDNIWIGFSGGLQRLTNLRGLRNFYPNTINTYIYSVFQDGEDRIWINSNNGIYYFNKNKEFKKYLPPACISNELCIASLMPGGNILLVSRSRLAELDSRSLKLTRSSQFPLLGSGIENTYITGDGEILLLTGVNGLVYYFPDFYSRPVKIESRQTSNLYQLNQYMGRIVGGSSAGIVEFKNGGFNTLVDTEYKIWTLYASDTLLWIGSDRGLGRIRDLETGNIEIVARDEQMVVKSIEAAKNKKYLWVGTNKGFSYYNISTGEWEWRIDAKDGLSGDEITTNGLFLDNNNLLWIGTYHGISNFNIRAKSVLSNAPVCYIENISINGKNRRVSSGSGFNHRENNFVFEISALSFANEKSVEYEFYLRGLKNNYSSYHRGREYKAYFNNLPAGKYQFIYKAKGKNNIWGYAESFEFTIRTAWYSTWIARIGLATTLVLLIYFLYRIRVRAIEKQNRKLEVLVNERTRDLELANTEIEAQRDLATAQRDKIADQQKEIVDSIHYAQRIQESMLPAEQVLKEYMPDHFILFKPRDIVSGDFYWAARQNGNVYFTAADCTGHGVPGAFMSILGMSFLNEIIGKYDNIEPNHALDLLRNKLIEVLHQQGEDADNKDGMDMVFCMYNPETRKLKFSAANNPLYHVRGGELTKIKGDPMPVSIHYRMEPFKLHSIDTMPGDRIYIFSDGYADQFGGPKHKKFLSRNFISLIESTSNQDIQSQCKSLDKAFEEWKADSDQVDDVVVIGIEI